MRVGRVGFQQPIVQDDSRFRVVDFLEMVSNSFAAGHTAGETKEGGDKSLPPERGRSCM